MKELHLPHAYWPSQVARGLLTGVLTGLAISVYSRMIAFCGDFNKAHWWLVLLIPAGACLTVLIYKVFGEDYRNSTTSAIEDINTHKSHARNWAESQIPHSLSPRLAVIAFLGAGITHFTGASGGKEGAGVQIGLACASCVEEGEAWLGRKLGREHDCRSDYYLMCGSGAAFAALFGSPIAGVLFGTQLASPRATRLDAYLPCLVSSYAAVITSRLAGVHVMRIPAFEPLAVTIDNLAVVLAAAILTGLYSRVFCIVLHKIRDFFRKRISNPYLMVLAPALVLLAISVITRATHGEYRYNGLGSDLLADLINGEASHYDDIVKLLMVAFTFAAGFVGGEVVPLMIVGAGFGMSLASLFSVPVGPMAALCSLGMLSGGTNLPLVCFALGLELYSYSEPCLLFLMVCFSFIASGKTGIYKSQNLPYR